MSDITAETSLLEYFHNSHVYIERLFICNCISDGTMHIVTKIVYGFAYAL